MNAVGFRQHYMRGIDTPREIEQLRLLFKLTASKLLCIVLWKSGRLILSPKFLISWHPGDNLGLDS